MKTRFLAGVLAALLLATIPATAAGWRGGYGYYRRGFYGGRRFYRAGYYRFNGGWRWFAGGFFPWWIPPIIPVQFPYPWYGGYGYGYGYGPGYGYGSGNPSQGYAK